METKGTDVSPVAVDESLLKPGGKVGGGGSRSSASSMLAAAATVAGTAAVVTGGALLALSAAAVGTVVAASNALEEPSNPARPGTADAGAALAAATPWKVVYFDAPTRGEQLRILLVVAGAPFVDERVKMGGLAELQHATLGDASPLMFDQCPMVVSPDGTTVAQTAACMQFVGRQTDLAPKDPDMDARAMALTLGSEVSGAVECRGGRRDGSARRASERNRQSGD